MTIPPANKSRQAQQLGRRNKGSFGLKDMTEFPVKLGRDDSINLNLTALEDRVIDKQQVIAKSGGAGE